MHKIITCTGFGGTGSSAISDLFKEFDNVKSCGNFEFSLAHEVDGISDLQHAIVDDFHRNKTTEAIYRFQKLIKFKFCNKKTKSKQVKTKQLKET